MPIAQALYPRYQIIFIFNNAKNHAVFFKYALQVADISKGVGGVQSFLYNRWYKKNQQRQIQFIWYSKLNSEEIEVHIQKDI